MRRNTSVVQMIILRSAIASPDGEKGGDERRRKKTVGGALGFHVETVVVLRSVLHNLHLAESLLGLQQRMRSKCAPCAPIRSSCMTAHTLTGPRKTLAITSPLLYLTLEQSSFNDIMLIFDATVNPKGRDSNTNTKPLIHSHTKRSNPLLQVCSTSSISVPTNEVRVCLSFERMRAYPPPSSRNLRTT